VDEIEAAQDGELPPQVKGIHHGQQAYAGKTALKYAVIDGESFLCNILIIRASISNLGVALMIYPRSRGSNHSASVLRISRGTLS